eukprot:c9594_g1_i2.p2 GENE.c9594_g1_i2~~c9594_g1_i2.p2  ORF type:complete len:174 (+),score=24.75 c9594_g1_i2:1511-2032(+)
MALVKFLGAAIYQSLTSPFRDTITSVSFIHPLSRVSLIRLTPTQIGHIALRLRDDGFSDHQIVIVLTAISDPSDLNLKRAFRLFQQSGTSEYINAVDFRPVARVVVGEDVEEAEIDKLFNAVDTDRNGKVDFQVSAILLPHDLPLRKNMFRNSAHSSVLLYPQKMIVAASKTF